MDSEKKMRMSRSPKGTSVYDRLTKPTLAATLKSKRGEDQNTKAQWKETMEERLAREEREEEEFWMKHNKQAKTNRPVTASAVTGTTERKERKTRQEREEFKVSRSPGFSSGMKSPDKSNGTNDESEDIDARRSRAERTVKVDYHISPYMQSQKKGYTFGGKAKDKKVEEAPGPGNYQYKSKAVEGPEYSIYKKYPQKIEPTPGPGDYEDAKKQNSGFTIGQRLREKNAEELPAPGQYEAISQLVEGPQYSIYQKRDQKIEQTPGPGDYNQPEKEQKGVTIGQRFGEKKIEDLPAPGQYSTKSHIVEGPQYSMYQKREQKLEQKPGPGDYNLPEQEQKGVTIGKRLADGNYCYFIILVWIILGNNQIIS